MGYALSVLAAVAGLFVWLLAFLNPRQLVPTIWFRHRWVRPALGAAGALLLFLGWLYWPRPVVPGEVGFATAISEQIRTNMALLFCFVGLILFVAGVVGLFTKALPFVPIKGRRVGGLSLGAGFVVLLLGGLLLPERGVTITAVPASATIKIIGAKYIGKTGPLTLTDDQYPVVVSAPNYHTLKTTLDIRKRRNFTLTLTPFTAQELATIQAQQEAKRQEAARRLAQAKAEEKRKAAAAALAAQKAAAEEKARQKAQAVSDDAFVQQESGWTPPVHSGKRIDPGTLLVTCHDQIQEQLAFPQEAHFPGIWEVEGAHEASNGDWDFRSYVDSKNAFGVKVRIPYTCTYDAETQIITAQAEE